ncbi:spore coat U domain-containing protein [Caballeronia sp. dw_19]|uniref:Csu type fimbrial protein n=1 Tax=Caballeronia sp. dw_19 TaxID=2719791 RepID=UPI001BD6DD92|nr:spore coat U domain-containing protein [Caballeronia sp. dw_19]
MNAFKLRTLVFALALVGSASAMAAGSTTATLTNSATIAASCTLTATGFTSTYDPVTANAGAAGTPVKDTSGSVTYTCTNGGTNALIALDGGGHDTGTSAIPIRHLAGTTHTTDLLAYNLYQESTYTTPWGYTATAELAAVEDGTQHVQTVYTEIPAGQSLLHVDTYNDTVIATITF